MVMNVGRHVDGKLRMQNAADSAAYSGGVVLARGMNTLAFTNHLLCDVFAVTAILREARDRELGILHAASPGRLEQSGAGILFLGISQVHVPGLGHPAKGPAGAANGRYLFGLGQFGERPGPAADGRDPFAGVDSQVSAGGRGCLSRHRPVGGPGDGLAERHSRSWPRPDVRRAVADRRPARGRRRRSELLARRSHLARR